MRQINRPPRGVGEKTVAEIIVLAASESITPFEAAGRLGELGRGARAAAMSAFVKLIEDMVISRCFLSPAGTLDTRAHANPCHRRAEGVLQDRHHL